MSELDKKDLQSQGIPQDVDAYVNYYGLKGDPFDPDSSLFFTTPQLEKMLRLFNYLARFSRKLVVVTGADGAGKTALLENFVNEQGEQDLVCFFAALNSDTPKQVLYEIAGQLGVDAAAQSESLEQLIKEIRDYSLQRLDHGKNCIVVIDDAHLLEKTVLEQLYQLTLNDTDQRCAISLLLCGQPSLLERVQTVVPSDVEAKALFHQQISPFSYDEMVQYLIMHFKENAGHSKPPFSGADYLQIHQQSEGLPGRVNEQAKQVLTGGVSRLVDSADSNKKPKGFVVLVAILMLAVGGVFWWQNEQQEINEDDVAQLGITGQVERLEERHKGDEVILQDKQIFAEPEQQRAELGRSEVAVDADAVELAPSVDAGLKSSPDVSELQLSPVAADVKDDVLPTHIVAASPGINASPEEGVAIDMAEAETISEPTPQAEKEVTAEEKAAAGLKEQKQPQELEAVTQPTKPSSRLTRDAERILAFEPSEYTMQLLGSRKEESIVAAMGEIPGAENMLYFKKTHKGAPWYVLIYGHYADRATANAAAAKLSADLKDIKPWVRGVSGIQDTLKANQ